MGVYDGSYVGHAAVTDFYGFPVENFVELTIGREVGVNQLKKLLSNVGLYCFAERGIEPNYIFSPSSSYGGRRGVF